MPIYNDNSQMFRSEYGHGKLGKETWKVKEGDMESWGRRHGKLGKETWKVGEGDMESWGRRHGKLEK